MKVFRSILSLLLAVIMVVSVIPGTLAATREASQEGYVPSDPYIYHYDVDGDSYEGPKYQHFSPYYGVYNYADGDRMGYNLVFTYSMYNTLTGQVVPTYSADAFTAVYSDNRYRSADMNTSSLTRDVAQNLSAILLNGFYLPAVAGETEEAYASRVEAKLETLGQAVAISDLTIGEAMAATQMAIWRTVHGEELTFNPVIRNVYTGTNPELFQYYELCNGERENGYYDMADGKITEESKAYITARIEEVYEYLLQLESEEKVKVLISEESIGGVQERASIRNADGTYDIEIAVYLTAELGEEDSLTLTAMVDPTHYAQTAVKNGRNQYALVIKNVPEECLVDEVGQIKNVTVAVDGVQALPQVVLFEAEGGADKCSTMIGMDMCKAPVHVETTVTLKNFGQYIPQNPYVYFLGVKENDPYRYQYFSPYTVEAGYKESTVVNTIFAYRLYNAVTETSVPAYCADIGVGSYIGTSYRRLNLEDSSAGICEPFTLRAIMEEGFYLPVVEGETDAEHTARAEARLATLREGSGISDLTVGEAISATQLAIWKAVHGGDLEFNSVVRAIYRTVTPDMFKYYDLCDTDRVEGHYTVDNYGIITPESKAYISRRIETLYNYLLDLEPVWEDKQLVSEESFGGVREKYTVRNQDGTYDICLEISVRVDMDPEDRLAFTAMADETHYAKVDLVDGYNDFTLTIENVPVELLKDMTTGEAKPITVSIDGMQSASQVVYLEAKGGKDMAQSMVAMDNSYVPVHEEMTLTLQAVDLIPELKVGRSLNLESNISINYAIPAELLADFSDYSIYCYVEGVEDPYVILPQVKNGYVYFTFDGLTALNMNDMVEAYLHVSLGKREAIYDLGEYSIATYAYTMMNKESTTETVKRLCANLLRYGAKAQLYKEYKVENLPDAGLTSEQSAYLTDLNSVKFSQPLSVLPDLEGATVTWVGSTMSLDSTVSVKLVVDVSAYAGDPSELELHVSYTDVKGQEKTVVLNPTVYHKEKKMYVFTMTQLNAAELRTELTCRVYAEGEAVSQTKLHCASTYGNNKTGTLLELCQALFAYVDCAKAVFG